MSIVGVGALIIFLVCIGVLLRELREYLRNRL